MLSPAEDLEYETERAAEGNIDLDEYTKLSYPPGDYRRHTKSTRWGSAWCG
jgi:hypothetical protein